MRALLVLNLGIWKQVNDRVNVIIKQCNGTRLGKNFSNEANFIRRISSASKRKLYCMFQDIISSIIIIGDFSKQIELIIVHNNYLRILILPIITRIQVNVLHEPLFDVRRKGLDLYPNQGWITINSHLTLVRGWWSVSTALSVHLQLVSIWMKSPTCGYIRSIKV